MSERSLFDELSGPQGPLVRVRLTVSYDGTDFRGVAPNPGVRTVVDELVRVLTPVLGSTPEIVMSGRTDAGVHARRQVLSFDAAEAKADADGLARIQKVVNSRLGPEIVAIDVAAAPSDFSARFDAAGRSYRYRIMNRPAPDPFTARFAWWVPEPLNLPVMQLACDPLLGEHDFSSFCRRPKVAADEEPLTLVRRVFSAEWSDRGDGELRFEISGRAFCRQMVRSIVGFHVAVGRGQRSAGELRAVMEARDRQVAEQPAPPHGLTLWDVAY